VKYASEALDFKREQNKHGHGERRRSQQYTQRTGLGMAFTRVMWGKLMPQRRRI
jgi:hypothetical protein